LIEGGVARAFGVVADAGERLVGALPPLLGYVGGLLVTDGVWREDTFAAGDLGPDDDRGAVPVAVAEVGALPAAVAWQLVDDGDPAGGVDAPVAQGGAAAVVVDGLRRGLDPVGDVVDSGFELVRVAAEPRLGHLRCQDFEVCPESHGE
jgi:hypothetical protein